MKNTRQNYKRKSRIFVGDFETTVYDGQTDTEVWASALVEIGTERVLVLHSLEDTFDYLTHLNQSVIVYYHNLKFDGAFWLSYLIADLKLPQAYEHTENTFEYKFLDVDDMPDKSFIYNISDMGQWYSIKIKWNNNIIELRDSLKLLPFSVERIGQSFGTKHKKLSMDYTGRRYAGCRITEEEKEYIKNDVLVVKEALEIMFEEGHKKLTIGSCCLSEYKSIIGKEEYDMMMSPIDDIEINESIFGSINADRYIRKSYRGGWCYLAHGKENKLYRDGVTADVNSLYPSMMSSESGNYFPIGRPHFWTGGIPKEARDSYINGRLNKKYFFVRFQCRFYLKDGKLPFVQIKGNPLYVGTESLETSDFYNRIDGKYYRYYMKHGEKCDTKVTLTMTMTDYQLFLEHYHVEDLEILDGAWFHAEIGIFDEYMVKYKKRKMESKGARRELAKLFLNNLYGKMATNPTSNFKVAYLKADGSIGFITVLDESKKAGYIPIGSAITSYARNFTIRTAQLNYHGVDKPGFIYADTDSIHCDLKPDELIGVPVHPTDFCHWKLESTWDEAIFTRQKTYVEHVIQEDLEDVNPYYNIKCAGMPKRCKNLFRWSMQGVPNDVTLNEEERAFVRVHRTLKDFKTGLCIPSKLMPKRIKGGVLLVPTTFQMR